jgi:membrane fusion protein (multidrug efflux system)
MLAALALLPLLSACNKGTAQKAPQGPPPPHVNVLTITPRAVPLTYPYAGRVAAYRQVEVRARVPGILVKRSYVEGAKVKAGDVLFQIDPATYQADLAKAKASVQQAEAGLAQARRNAKRASELFQKKIASEQSRDDALSAVDTAAATLAGAEAQRKSAQISLDYTTIKAPISGVTGRNMLSVGSLVGTSAADSLLTSITRLDPVYVNFAFTETERNQIRHWLADGTAKLDNADGRFGVKLVLDDGTTYGKGGYVDFTGSQIDQQSGTIQARAVVPNPDDRLVPGQFVRVLVTGVVLKSAIVVPEKAVQQGPQGTFVYALEKDGTAAARPVTLGRETDQGWVVPKGLAAGAQVVVDGVVKLHPGAKAVVDTTFTAPDQVKLIGEGKAPAAGKTEGRAAAPSGKAGGNETKAADAKP